MLPRLDVAMLAALTAPAPVADGGAGAALTGDARQAAFQRALQPLVGLAVPAEVMSSFSDGTFLVKVADNNVRMALPPEVQVGSQVALTVMSATPRPTFQLNTNSAQGGAPALVYSDAAPADASDPAQLYRAPLASQDAPVRLPPGGRPAVPVPPAQMPGGAAQTPATAAGAQHVAGGQDAAAQPGGAATAVAAPAGSADAAAGGAVPGAAPRPSAGAATVANMPATDTAAAPASAEPPASGAQPASTPAGNGKPGPGGAPGAPASNSPAASPAGNSGAGAAVAGDAAAGRPAIAAPAHANPSSNASAASANLPGAPTPGGQPALAGTAGGQAGATGGPATPAAGAPPETAAPASGQTTRPDAASDKLTPAAPRPGPAVMPAMLAANGAAASGTPAAATAQRAGAAPAADAGTAAEAPAAANGPAGNPASLPANSAASAAAARMALLNAAAVGVMVANNGLVRSQALAAALLGKAPLTPASELPDLDASTPAATLSSTARVLSTMLGTAQGTTGSATVLVGKTPMVAGGPPEPGQLAQKLQETIAQSGLFYESHVTDWVKGERTMPELMREPQMQRLAQAQDQATASARSGPDLAASQMVNQQLHTHEQARVQWQGEAWPGQPMQWDIRREGRESGQQQGGAEPDQPEQVWRSGVRFRFAILGQVSATVTLVGEQVHIQMQTDTDQSALTLRAYAERLEQAMAAAGAPLSSLNIARQGGAEADAGMDHATAPGAPE